MPHKLILDFSDLKDKSAVITGGAGVLCTAFAQALSSAGVKLALLDLNETAAKQSAERIKARTGVAAVGVQCDVLSKEALEKALAIIQPTIGPIDILINGAGGNAPKATTSIEQLIDPAQIKESFYGLELEGFKDAFDLNFIGTLLPTQILSRDMVERKKGVIINISSMNAFRPLTKIPAYSAAKSAVSNFTEWLAVHLAPVGIRVNAIAPGFFLTEQLKFLAFDDDGNLTPRYQRVLKQTPMGRLGEPNELQGTLLYLASDLSSFVTGTVIPVDGGFNANSGV